MTGATLPAVGSVSTAVQEGAPVAGQGLNAQIAAVASICSTSPVSVAVRYEQKTFNPWTTRSARGCYLCFRYGLSPMCPERTLVPFRAYR